MKRIALSIIFVVALTVAGCGGGDGSDSSASTAETAATTSSESPRSAAAEVFRPKPKVNVPNGPPPKQLQIKDLIEGTGAEAKAGRKVGVHYVLVDYETGKELESIWRRGQPGTFDLGTGRATEGWNKGLPGMRVGGRRELIVPPGSASALTARRRSLPTRR